MEEMNKELVQAIRAHLVTYGIEDILTKEPTLCVETSAQIIKQGLFAGKPSNTLHASILTDQWLVIAALPEGKSPGVISARYSDITAQDYANTAEYKLIPNCGLDVFGIHANSEQGAGSIFIPLGPEPAAQKFRIILRDMIARSL
jgi:hypothetical protein